MADSAFYGTLGPPCSSLNDLEKCLESVFSTGAEGVWVHFSAGVRESDRRKWCPDCCDADPVLKYAFETAQLDVVGVSIPRPMWKEQGENKGANHPYRLVYGINSIPGQSLTLTVLRQRSPFHFHLLHIALLKVSGCMALSLSGRSGLAFPDFLISSKSLQCFIRDSCSVDITEAFRIKKCSQGRCGKGLAKRVHP